MYNPNYSIQQIEYLQLLKDHGFHNAAQFINCRDVDIKNALLEWKNYPKCMNKYPKKLRKKPMFF